jgi:hypothetical protein
MSHPTADEMLTAANALGIARGSRDAVVALAISTGSTMSMTLLSDRPLLAW